MKYLNTMDIIKDFKGTEILGQDKEPLRIKDILLQYIGGYKGKEGKKIILARKIGQKIYDTKVGQCELEDAELDLLEEALKVPQHAALILAPIYEALEKAKHTKPRERAKIA